MVASLMSALPGSVAQGLIWGILAIGVYITYKVLDFADLTVDGSLATGGAVAVMCMLNGANTYVALILAFLAGMLAGLVTGLFHTALGIPPILAGILTQLGLYSVNLKIMGKSNQAINVDKFDLLVSLRYIKNVPIYRNTILLVAVIIVVLIAFLYWFFGTELGCSLRATGCNDKMARAQGINTDFSRVLGLMVSNGLVGLSSALLAQYQGYADINSGVGILVVGLASVIIGEVFGGRRNITAGIICSVFGAVIYRFIIAFAIKSSIFPAYMLKFLSAVIVAIALSIPAIKQYIGMYRTRMGGRR